MQLRKGTTVMAVFQSGRKISAGLLVATCAAMAALIGQSDRANALSLQLTSGAATATVNDPGNTGAVVFSGAFANFLLNVSVGLSDPLLGSLSAPHMDLNSVTVANAVGGTLTIALTDTGFTGAGGLVSFMNQIGGTLVPGTLSVKTYLDASDTPFGLATLLTSQSFTNGAFSGTATGAGLTGNSPYSLTQVITLQLTGGASASFDSDLQTTPLPAALPLFASGLGALGFAAFRRKRRTAAAAG
jgi:hypothetical protein